MTKVFITREISKTYQEKIKDLGYQIVTDLDQAQDADIALGGLQLKKVDFEKFDHLKAVFLTSMGVDYLPLDYLVKKDIMVCNNAGVYGDVIGEFIVYNLLQLQKANRFFIEKQRDHLWEKPPRPLESLREKTVLFFGTGNLAQAGAKRLLPFGTHLVGYRKTPKDQEPFHEIVTEETLKPALEKADFLVVTLPKTPETYHFVNEELLKACKKGVKIVNVARGDIVDENALIQALEEGQVAGACLDVFEEEPLKADSPLWDFDQVYITPHYAYSSEQDRTIEYRGIMENLRRYQKKEPLVHQVDRNKGY